MPDMRVRNSETLAFNLLCVRVNLSSACLHIHVGSVGEDNCALAACSMLHYRGNSPAITSSVWEKKIQFNGESMWIAPPSPIECAELLSPVETKTFHKKTFHIRFQFVVRGLMNREFFGLVWCGVEWEEARDRPSNKKPPTTSPVICELCWESMEWLKSL